MYTYSTLNSIFVEIQPSSRNIENSLILHCFFAFFATILQKKIQKLNDQNGCLVKYIHLIQGEIFCNVLTLNQLKIAFLLLLSIWDPFSRLFRARINFRCAADAIEAFN